MNTRTSAGRLLAGLASVALLAGCSAGASPTPAPATPAATPTAAPPAGTPAPATPASTPTATAPAATPAAVTYGPVAVVSGSSTCPDAVTGTEMTDAQGVVHRRGGTVSCTATVNDTRVSGTSTRDANWDAWGTPEAGARVQWGTARLTNEKGSWEGTYTAVWDSVHGVTIATWYTGSGGYAGLSYFELITGLGPHTIRGQIQPGDPPNPTIAPAVAAVTPPPDAMTNPTAAPSPLSYGPVAVVEGSSRSAGTWGDFGYRSTDAAGVERWAGTVSYVHEMNDPRVSGRDVTDLNMDGWESPSNGAAIQWGSVQLTNEEGSWTGTFSGVFDSVRGDTFVAWLTGSGAYAGLTYFLATAPDARFLGGGQIQLQGQIYPGTPPQP